ncbi:MAG: molybdopterin molybdotransferase MoeA [Flavobacteriaceae bacterium]|nr:molybdopterin molybdotransferase MoeA [Flavobacteriaceae bacterium]MDZ4147166.1 molybdopterin molybdotransferase MoeA [Flavobacteriaceae bacterium]
MITFKEAYNSVMKNKTSWGLETVHITASTDRILASDVFADRDFPPFQRATKDGIAVNYKAIQNDETTFRIEGIAAAGSPQLRLKNTRNCIEIMTGAVLPENTDTVIMYEETEIKNGAATIRKIPEIGQNIHRKGSDEKQGDLLLKAPMKITSAEIGVLASVGISEVSVYKNPKASIISTGNELVDIHQSPLPHQIRKSNSYSLLALLEAEKIQADLLHLADEPKTIEEKLSEALKTNDILLLSGGVSKGKYDYIPQILNDLGVEKVFHFVLQQPGKPFWFGVHPELKTVIFSFPGNPVSTFANYHIYFKDWFAACFGLKQTAFEAILAEDISGSETLTKFIKVKTYFENGQLFAEAIPENGSGDLTSLSRSDGFVKIDPGKGKVQKGARVSFIPTRKII